MPYQRKNNLTNFIKENRNLIDAYVRRRVPNARYFNDAERRLWVLNDEQLYKWARAEGVRL